MMKMMNLRMRNLDLMGHLVLMGNKNAVPDSWNVRMNLRNQMNLDLVVVLVSSFSLQMLMWDGVPPLLVGNVVLVCSALWKTWMDLLCTWHVLLVYVGNNSVNLQCHR